MCLPGESPGAVAAAEVFGVWRAEGLLLRRLLKKLARTFSDELPDRLPGVPETED